MRSPVSDERALLMAVPLRHLESLAAVVDGATLLPAGGVGDLDAASPGTSVLVMATDAGDAEVPAVTWHARFVARVPYEPGAPWPDGLPPTWLEEHRPVVDPPESVDNHDEDDWDDDDDDDEDEIEPQAFLTVAGLEPLPREQWVFTNELVRKQARRGRTFRPRVPTMVDLPD